MADIVGSLFGATPQQVQSEMVAPIFNRANQFAQLNPMQQAQYGLYSGGAMLGQGVAGLLGGEDPRLVQARQMQQVKDWIAQSGVDVNTPEGLAQAAQYAQSIGATEGAMFLGQKSQELQRTASKMKLEDAQTRRTEALAQREDVALERQDKLDQILQELGPDASYKQIQKAVFPYLSSEEKVKMLTSKYAMGTGGGSGGDGVSTISGVKIGDKTDEGFAVMVGTDKVGRIKLSDGRTIPAAQYYKKQDEVNAYQSTLDSIESLQKDPKDIKAAFGAGGDYTNVPWAGSKYSPVGETTAAQRRINALAIRDKLQKLADLKGATSDKEFVAINKDFPVYTDDPKVMEAWLKRANAYFKAQVAAGRKQYGVMEMPEKAADVTPTGTKENPIKL